MEETLWSRIREQNSVYKEFLENVGNGSPNGQCIKGDKCIFRHVISKRGKITQPNPSPNSFMQQDERNASGTRSPRGKSPSSGRMSRWQCKDYLKGTCNNSFCEKWHPPQNACTTRPRVVVGLGEIVLTRTPRLMNSRLKGPKRMMTKVQ